MQETEFRTLADATLNRVESWLEDNYPDADAEWAADGVLNIETEDGQTIIVNRHSTAQEIWIAAKSGGFHYRWDGSDWRDTRDQSLLMDKLQVLMG
jgi:CyaY protein